MRIETNHDLSDGNTDTWRQFHDAHAQRLWRWVARMMGGSAHAVGDIVQEAFIAAAQGAHRYDPARGSQWAWLWGIARRQMALHWRRGGRHAADVSSIVLPSTLPMPEDIAAQQETALQVRRALMAIDDESAFLLAGKYFDAMTTEALAAALGISAHAAESRLVRARRAFRGAYASQNPSPKPEDAYEPR
jgi:RNA polymerase sigma-70 factor (ECF subfamily)